MLTLTEVLAKPIASGDAGLAERFADFLKYGRNIRMLEISEAMADGAGRLRGRYPALRTLDAVQISAALQAHAEAFLTNDARLRKIREIRILVLKDYL